MGTSIRITFSYTELHREVTGYTELNNHISVVAIAIGMRRLLR